MNKRIFIDDIWKVSDNEFMIMGRVQSIINSNVAIKDYSGTIILTLDAWKYDLNVNDIVSVVVVKQNGIIKVKECNVLSTACRDEETTLLRNYLDRYNVEFFRKINSLEDSVRDFLKKEKFIELRNPILWVPVQEYGTKEWRIQNPITKETPYILLQSPNILNLISAVAGIERNFQFHPCFRLAEENSLARNDSLIEFTQLAITAAFLTNEEAMRLIEDMFFYIIKKHFNIEIEKPFEILDYHESMKLYSTDHPDLRFRKFYRPSFIINGYKYTGLIIPAYVNKKIEEFLINKTYQQDRENSNFFSYDENKTLKQKLGDIKADYLIDEWFENNEIEKVGYILLLPSSIETDIFYNRISKTLYPKLFGKVEKYKFCWIKNYPFINELEYDSQSLHDAIGQNIFTKRIRNSNDTEGIDLVLNGIEIASGGQKVNTAEEFIESLELLKIKDKQKNYDYFIKVLKMGAPPLFSIGIGWERTLLALFETKTISDVMVFPKDQFGNPEIISICE